MQPFLLEGVRDEERSVGVDGVARKLGALEAAEARFTTGFTRGSLVMRFVRFFESADDAELFLVAHVAAALGEQAHYELSLGCETVGQGHGSSTAGFSEGPAGVAVGAQTDLQGAIDRCEYQVGQLTLAHRKFLGGPLGLFARWNFCDGKGHRTSFVPDDCLERFNIARVIDFVNLKVVALPFFLFFRTLQFHLHYCMSYIKKPDEIAAILEGGRLMGEILEKLGKMVKPGVTAWELNEAAEAMIAEVGGATAFKGYRGRRNDPPFPSTICFSKNEELVHGIATKEKVIEDGDIISLDIGMRYPGEQGFFTDTAITVPVGKIPSEVEKLLQVTYDALEAGIKVAQVGNTVADIGKAVESFVQSQGNYGIIRDLVGHGVGHAVHEDPRVPNYYDKHLESWVLEPGVVIAIEPMIALGTHEVDTAEDGWTILTTDRKWNAHFEHTIVITKDGPQVATRRPSEL